MHADKLDAIDLKILELLQKSGRTKRNQLAEQVNLSIPSISERMHKMEKAGVIKTYNAIVEPRKIGLQVTAFVIISTEPASNYVEILKQITVNDEVLECHTITGEGSNILKVRTQSTDTLERLLMKIQDLPGVTNTKTHIVLSTSKETTVLPLNYYKS
ncbi:winged helix-turn-helix transcriptional regulator [candidate division KSB1 bacterium]|nr:winged helix-turn-helix transcriptional regulator [candidate division KSB1 bacterium]